MGIILYADSMDAVDAGTRAGAKTICFEPAGFPYPSGVDAESENARIEAAIRIALDTCRAHDARLIWKLPRITRQGEIDAIRALLPRLHAAGLRACMVENPGTALAVADAAPGLALAGSWGLNVFNAETVRVFAREHFTLLQCSPELSGNEIAVLAREVRRQGDGPELAVFVQGNLETMVTEDCLRAVAIKCRRTSGPCRNTRWLGIRDETGHLFPVRVDGACRSHIFNATETCLVDAVPELVANRHRYAVTIDARGKHGRLCGEMVRVYREAIALPTQKPGARDP